MCVLLIEDDLGIAELVSKVLTKEGRRVEKVHSGYEAIQFLERTQPGLMVLDYSLPDMNASELLEHLSGKGIEVPPFIVFTGQGDEMIAVEMMKLGAREYLLKDASLIKRIPSVVDRVFYDIRREDELKKALTERRKTEEKLLEEQRRLANIIKATDVGTWEWNVKTGEVVLNERWAGIIGYTLEELAPVTVDAWQKIIHPDDFVKSENLLQQHIRGEVDYYELELRLKHKTGKWVWALSRGCVIDFDKDGDPLLMAGTHQDINDRKEKEDLEKQMDIARKTLVFKQNFLATMSHEMRTPLTGILGVVQLLEKTNLDDKQLDFVNTLRSSSENLKDIIDQVLDYSKLEAGEVRLKLKTFSVSNLIRKTEKLFHGLCNKPITFSNEQDSTLPNYIRGDEKRIMQVINNLLVNALKFTREGTIKLSFKKDKHINERELLVRVEVKDTGIGVDPQLVDQIFSPFSQINQIETSSYEGAGLGLSICKNLVKMHGGEIGVNSEPGKGSTFWFTFKAGYEGDQKPLVVSGDATSKMPEMSLRILLVEDKMVTQKVIRLMLSEMGHHVNVANNGKEAIDKFKPGVYDLVLMDIQMPMMDGITATEKLRSAWADLPPVVGLSANAFEGDREKYMEMGFDEYLTKPLHLDEFTRLMQKLFEA